MNSTLIEFHNISKTFELKDRMVPALKNVSASITEGTIVGVIGRSGAGKSTFLRCINGLETPDSGNLQVDQTELSNAKEIVLQGIRRKVGMIFQQFNLLSRRTVLENIRLPLEIEGVDTGKANKKALEYLKLVRLEEKADRYPRQLSGGQKQRVAIARALVSHAKVLLCDEATSALDPETTADILILLKELNRRLGITIVLITHEIAVIRDICDKVLVMDRGTIVEQGDIEQIFSSPKHAVTQSFINSLISRKIPKIVKDQILSSPKSIDSLLVLRLIFSNNIAEKPIISEFIKKSAVDISIFAGYIDHIGKSTFGTLIVALANNKASFAKTSEYLTSQGIGIETLGYIEQE